MLIDYSDKSDHKFTQSNHFSFLNPCADKNLKSFNVKIKGHIRYSRAQLKITLIKVILIVYMLNIYGWQDALGASSKVTSASQDIANPIY